ncbi:putative ABC transporter, ATP-binding protein [Desulfonema limicola]|uniref:ABC transporter, ATP-binding protein n=1 Tax=Desulfonema limicola TaxID=45656 RepID=A0A975BBQ5_9BACT|nr:sn-glycerol-3-phosphate ABC transporter ATP-binding protein UgpC [Desulfonema limicola]QTA82416.1 putative ABC transporter, ATP-binding protein [Desulfonema limicola]
MANVLLKNLVKNYGKMEVVHKINLDIEDREFVVLVGPSGCGKSTTLRMIAGLEEISRGEIIIGDRVVNNVAPKDRDAAMVFQNYALYPHMNVFKNMAFGLQLRKIPKPEIESRVNKAAEMLELTEYLKRKPHELSGGQRQRVAMGRAIVRNPSVFLFDEPLSNLDAKLRTQMRIEIKQLHRKVQTTTIYVTHDQVEAMTLADRIVVMRDGYIEQVGNPMEIFQNPVNTFVAGFIGSPPMNLVPGKIIMENNTAGLKFNDEFMLPIPEKPGKDMEHGKDVIIGLRTEDITINNDNNLLPDNWKTDGIAEVVEPLGSETNLHMNLKGIKLVARCDGRLKVNAGDRFKMALNLAHLHIFDAQTTLSIY